MMVAPKILICIVLAIFSKAGTACQITETSCPCTFKPSKGSCLRRQTDNTCLLGECNDGYKCDCFGYEKCTRAACGIYKADGDVVESTSTPFSCHLTPDGGTCTTFEEFIDTVDGANNAKAEATALVNETCNDMGEGTNDLTKGQEEIFTVVRTIAQLDQFAEEVSEEERNEVNKEAEEITNAVKEIQEETAALNKEVTESITANSQAGFYQRMCRRKEREVQAAEKEVEREVKNGRGKGRRCEGLKEGIKRIRKECGDAAIEAGRWTKKAENTKKKCNRRREDIKKIRRRAEEARGRCVSRAQDIVKRIRGSAQ